MCGPAVILKKRLLKPTIEITTDAMALAGVDEKFAAITLLWQQYSFRVFLSGFPKKMLKKVGFQKLERLTGFGGGQFSGAVNVLQYILRKTGFSNELRYMAVKK